jgi:hypothetical protein
MLIMLGLTASQAPWQQIVVVELDEPLLLRVEGNETK